MVKEGFSKIVYRSGSARPPSGASMPFRADVVQAFFVGAESGTPLGLDGTVRGVLQHVDDRLAFSRGDLGECVLHRHGGSRIPVPVELHV